LAAGINVFDLIATSVFAANGVNGLSIPAVNLNLGLANLDGTSVTITAPPKIACGAPGVVAKTAQVSVNIGANVLPPNGVLDVASIGLQVSIPIAAAEVTLRSPLDCV